MKKIFRRFKIVNIDVYIYRMRNHLPLIVEGTNYEVEKSKTNKNKIRYYISDAGEIIHESYLFSKVFLLKLINKKGPVIGDCKTIHTYRGRSIYPYVINKIAKDLLTKNTKEVFVIVDKDNVSSIKGIEKAHYERVASIKAKRWLWFYLKKDVSII